MGDRERAATQFAWAGIPRGPVAKICGLTRLEDIVAAWDLGAWALGFVFTRSPRRLAPKAARRLIQDAVDLAEAQSLGDHRPLMIGVFGDDSAGEVAETVIEAGLDGVQLHGSAGPSGSEVRAALGGRRRGS
jgi:phosphoribosylanthranilate isomerase